MVAFGKWYDDDELTPGIFIILLCILKRQLIRKQPGSSLHFHTHAHSEKLPFSLSVR